VEIYTIGFTQTTAERFFKRLVDAGAERLLETSFGPSGHCWGVCSGS
jgi:hypothetical protein